MRSLPFILFSIMVAGLFPDMAFAQNASLTLRITSIPANYPLLFDTLYLAGEPNEWDPWNAEFRFEQLENGTYEIELTGPENTSFDYKVTRGFGWHTVEGSASGGFIENRTATFTNSVTEISIAGWEDVPAPHTGSGYTLLLHSGMHMSALDRYRRCWIWLPEDYYQTETHYPVLYLQDGQNLFSLGNSFAGEWEIDESMSDLQHSCLPAIVVGIDNGGSFRIEEYSPYENDEYGGGRGEDYLDFLVNELKPFVDGQFRTLQDPEHTAIAGSSLGALIALYAAKRHPGVFGRIGLFSPAFWFNPELYEYVSTATVNPDQRYYFLAGSTESSTMVPLMDEMAELLIQSGHPAESVFITEHADGAHSEWYWAREFPSVFEWLFCDETTGTGERNLQPFSIAPNPADSSIILEGMGEFTSLRLYTLNGELLRDLELTGESSVRLQVSDIPTGLYYLRASNIDGAAESLRLVIQH